MNFFAVLDSLASCFKKISAGDLAFKIPVHNHNELGKLFDDVGHMQISLGANITSGIESTEVIGHNTAEIANGNQDLSSRTERRPPGYRKLQRVWEKLKRPSARTTTVHDGQISWLWMPIWSQGRVPQ